MCLVAFELIHLSHYYLQVDKQVRQPQRQGSRSGALNLWQSKFCNSLASGTKIVSPDLKTPPEYETANESVKFNCLANVLMCKAKLMCRLVE